MLYVAPRAPYTSRLALGLAGSGLTGTIRYRLLDNDTDQNDPIYGPSTADIIEDPTGSGSYVFNGTAPVRSRLYSRAWDTGPGTELYFDEDMFVTSTVAAPGQPSGYDLCTLEDVQRYVPSYVPNDDTDQTLQDLITATSTLIPRQSEREIVWPFAGPEARRFTVDSFAARRRVIPVGDLAGTEDLAISLYHADNTLDAVMTDDLYFLLYEGKREPTSSWEPITDIAFPSGATNAPTIVTGKVLEVTGHWGFAEIPTFIREATAARVILRYISEVDARGTGFAAAVRDSGLNLGGLFQSAQDALVVLGGKL